MNGIDGDAPPPSRRRRRRRPSSSVVHCGRATADDDDADDASARDGPMARGAVARDPPWRIGRVRPIWVRSIRCALVHIRARDGRSCTARIILVRLLEYKAGHAIGVTRDLDFCAECPRIVRRMSENCAPNVRETSRVTPISIDGLPHRWAAASMGDAHRCRWAADRPIDRSMARRARRRRRRRPRDDDDGSRAS